MKNFFLLMATAITLFILQSCGETCDCKELQATLNNRQARINELEQAALNAPTKEGIIKDYEMQLAAKKKAEEDSLTATGLSNLNWDAFPLFKSIKPQYDVTFLRNYNGLYDNVSGIASSLTALFKGQYSLDVLKEQFKDPADLNKFFEANKGFIEDVLIKTNTYATAKKHSKILLPYMNGTAPTARIVMFDSFFKKYGKEDGIPTDNDEWQGMLEKTKMTDEDLFNHYMAYLFAKRRDMEGGKELKNTYVKVLTFVNQL